MPTYVVSFQDGRIGRDHNIRPRAFHADDYGGLAQAVLKYARRHLLSAYPEVMIDHPSEDAEPYGLIFAGARAVSHFDIVEVPQR